MLAETFAIVAALHIVKASRIAAVVAGEDSPLVIDFAAERVAAAFCEDFVDTFLRVITPDDLAE